MANNLAQIRQSAYQAESLVSLRPQNNPYAEGTPEHEARKEGAKARIKRGMTTRGCENPYLTT